MDLIKPQWSIIKTQDHLAKLCILKRCLENSINNVHVVSKSLYKKRSSNAMLNYEDKANDKTALNRINYSISYYTSILDLNNNEITTNV
jgi:hypothetical protein